MSDIQPDRIRVLRDLLVQRDLDALLVTHLPNIRWITGFSGSSGLVLLTSSEVVLLTDFRYETQVGSELRDLVRAEIVSSSLWAGLRKHLAKHPGVTRIGFEPSSLTFSDYLLITEWGGRWQWKPVAGLVDGLRERKDASELRLIREAVVMAETALDAVLQVIRPGLSETALAGLLEKALRDVGSEASPFPVIIASGENSALPHARPGSRVLSSGDFVLLDFGAVAGGYCSDITRTVVLGRADAEQREVYETVLGANRRAVSQVRSGMRGLDADALAREYIDARGFGSLFGHSLGHGIGLEVHEAPRLSMSSSAILPVGSVVTIEPGIYKPGWGGVRIEDDVVLAEGGAVELSSFSRDLLEIV